MLNSRWRRIKEWIAMRLPFLWLILSIFSTSYFPVVSRYSINTLFNTQKRGYFDFLFTNLQLKRRSPTLWVRWFGVILLACYILRGVSEAFWVFYEERAKQNFRKITSGKFGDENTEWLGSFTDKVVSESASFFFSLCELLIDLRAVISINRTREIGTIVLRKTFFCLVITLCSILIMKRIVEGRKIVREESGFSFIITKVQQKLVFSELGTIFTTFYFLFFPSNEEVVNAVLLGFNVSSLVAKMRRFARVVPQTISTYKSWKEACDMHMTKSLPIELI